MKIEKDFEDYLGVVNCLNMDDYPTSQVPPRLKRGDPGEVKRIIEHNEIMTNFLPCTQSGVRTWAFLALIYQLRMDGLGDNAILERLKEERRLIRKSKGNFGPMSKASLGYHLSLLKRFEGARNKEEVLSFFAKLRFKNVIQLCDRDLMVDYSSQWIKLYLSANGKSAKRLIKIFNDHKHLKKKKNKLIYEVTRSIIRDIKIETEDDKLLKKAAINFHMLRLLYGVKVRDKILAYGPDEVNYEQKIIKEIEAYASLYQNRTKFEGLIQEIKTNINSKEYVPPFKKQHIQLIKDERDVLTGVKFANFFNMAIVPNPISR